MIPAITAASIGAVLGALALRNATWRSATAYALCLVMIGVALLSSVGMPRPAWTAIWTPSDAILIAHAFDEPDAIFVWVVWDGASEPTSYRLPWSEEMAKSIIKAETTAQDNGVPVAMHGLRKLPGRRMFYPKPRQPIPPKAAR